MSKEQKSLRRSGLAQRIAAGAVAAGMTVAAASPLPEARETMATQAAKPLFEARTYQLPIWMDHSTPLLLFEMGRQLGKSQTLADWAVNQIAADFAAGRETSLVTVLSNSKANGQEFAIKSAESARRWGTAQAEIEEDFPDGKEWQRMKFDEMRFEIRIRMGNKVGRILVLAANPRTARGFSGHLILDEFAFHQDAAAIWEAAEPIISSRPEYLCRIASTHNTKRSLFYQMCRGGDYPVYSVRRSEAWAMGQGQQAAWADFVDRWRSLDRSSCEQWLRTLPKDQIHWIMGGGEEETNPCPREVDRLCIKSLKKKGRMITPQEAEKEATNQRAYRQNYENEPSDDGGALLGMALITAAERNFTWEIAEDEWDLHTFVRIASLPRNAELYVGQDVGRTNDLSAVVIGHKDGQIRRMIGLLTMRGKDLAHQRRQMQALIKAAEGRIKKIAIDFTGIGTGLCDELGDIYRGLIIPVHFGATVEMDAQLAASEGRKAKTMRITERMGLDLLRAFDDGHMEIKQDTQMRADLNRPGRVVSGNGMVSISAERTKDDHSDRFWALALMEHAILDKGAGGTWTAESLAEVETGGRGLYPDAGTPLRWSFSATPLEHTTRPHPPVSAVVTPLTPLQGPPSALNFLKWPSAACLAFRKCIGQTARAIRPIFHPPACTV